MRGSDRFALIATFWIVCAIFGLEIGRLMVDSGNTKTVPTDMICIMPEKEK